MAKRIPIAALGALLALPSGGFRAPGVTSVTLRPDQVYNGSATTGTVTLDAASLTGPVDVALASANPTMVRVPSTVRIAAGSRSASFPVSTAAGSGGCTAITAAVGTSKARATMYVDPPPLPRNPIDSELSTTGLSVPASIVGGQSAGGRVTYTERSTTGGTTTVQVSSLDTRLATVSPSSVVIDLSASSSLQNRLSGSSTQPNITISTSPVREPGCVIIRANYVQRLVRIDA